LTLQVLKGHIAVAQSIFPNKATGHRLDSFARKFLWDVKLDYAHGSGHGIGHYMNVHEGPQSMGSTPAEDDSGLEADMFMSNEPGYYLQDDYGVRIENIVRVGKVEDAPGEFLELETVSFVPIEMDLIDFQMLTPEEVRTIPLMHSKVIFCYQKQAFVCRFLGLMPTTSSVERRLEITSMKLVTLRTRRHYWLG